MHAAPIFPKKLVGSLAARSTVPGSSSSLERPDTLSSVASTALSEFDMECRSGEHKLELVLNVTAERNKQTSIDR